MSVRRRCHVKARRVLCMRHIDSLGFCQRKHFASLAGLCDGRKVRERCIGGFHCRARDGVKSVVKSVVVVVVMVVTCSRLMAQM